MRMRPGPNRWHYEFHGWLFWALWLKPSLEPDRLSLILGVICGCAGDIVARIGPAANLGNVGEDLRGERIKLGAGAPGRCSRASPRRRAPWEPGHLARRRQGIGVAGLGMASRATACALCPFRGRLTGIRGYGGGACRWLCGGLRRLFLERSIAAWHLARHSLPRRLALREFPQPAPWRGGKRREANREPQAKHCPCNHSEPLLPLGRYLSKKTAWSSLTARRKNWKVLSPAGTVHAPATAIPRPRTLCCKRSRRKSG